MPKLLSQSKHEEFKSNSTFQIKDQKERRAKCEEKHHYRKASPASTVPSYSPCSPAFHALVVFAVIFGFSPFYPCFIHLCLDWMVLHLVCKAT